MIRHRRHDEFLLFTQDDHAALAGHLASHVGGLFTRASDVAIQAVALHDSGWPLHDDLPTLNPAGDPLHVFESPVDIAVRVWSASVEKAAAANPYAGLLVSVHVLNLSARSMESHAAPRDVFELNKFQHRQIELQEALRQSLGFGRNLPLQLGLARPGETPREDLLRFDYQILRAMDIFSLALLCSEPVADDVRLCTRPGGQEATIRIVAEKPFQIRLEPWPFDVGEINSAVPCRQLRSGAFADVDAFREEFFRSALGNLQVSIRPA